MSSIRTHAYLLAAFFFGLLSASLPCNAQETDSFAKSIKPFLAKHCFECHGEKKQESLIRFDKLDSFGVENTTLWTKVHEALTTGEMPPEDHPQPTAAEVKVVLDWIKQVQRGAGTGSTRRLNRRELSAALRDLTGRHVDYTFGLPEDGTINGFDTGAAGLQDAADSVTQIMEVTRRAVDGIKFRDEPASESFAFDFSRPEWKDSRKEFSKFKDRGLSAKPKDVYSEPGTGLLVKPKWVGDRDSFTVYLPPPTDRRGVARMTVEVSVAKYTKGVPDLNLWVEIGGKKLDYRPIGNAPDKPLTLIYEVQLEDIAIQSQGIDFSVKGVVEMPYGIKGFPNEDKSKPEDKIPSSLYRPSFDKKKVSIKEQPLPFLMLHRMEIETDHVKPWPPAEWQLEVGDIQDDEESASKLLTIWMRRAWRRPIKKEEQAHFDALYRKLRSQGFSFDAALRATFQSVLLSGPFRYLSSPADEDPVVAQHAIASRLSFMFLGSPPDAELLELAVAGKLRDPKVLDAQVTRLLLDSRSDGFVRPFITQWLKMDQPITVAMQRIQQQDFRFGRYLKSSMREETIQYFATLIAENRPVSELIESDWTMMNDSLAKHYGYDDVASSEFRKVKLRKDDPRGGGILGHAGIQSMLCWMGDNWVIYRGAWAMRHILDDPPPPPPLEVPELNQFDGENKGKPFREVLKRHQEDPKCTVCHTKMDPLGFAFQNFDLSGRWRDVEHERYVRNELDGKIEWYGAGKTRPVDSKGKLPRGEEFESFQQCKQLMVKHYQKDVVSGLLKNFMIYATGRTPDIDDMEEIRAIIKRQEKSGFRLAELLKDTIRSDAFLAH